MLSTKIKHLVRLTVDPMATCWEESVSASQDTKKSMGNASSQQHMRSFSPLLLIILISNKIRILIILVQLKIFNPCLILCPSLQKLAMAARKIKLSNLFLQTHINAAIKTIITIVDVALKFQPSRSVFPQLSLVRMVNANALKITSASRAPAFVAPILEWSTIALVNAIFNVVRMLNIFNVVKSVYANRVSVSLKTVNVKSVLATLSLKTDTAYPARALKYSILTAENAFVLLKPSSTPLENASKDVVSSKYSTKRQNHANADLNSVERIINASYVRKISR